jgi:hypothetical protein
MERDGKQKVYKGRVTQGSSKDTGRGIRHRSGFAGGRRLGGCRPAGGKRH